jgi:hypothetical protein
MSDSVYVSNLQINCGCYNISSLKIPIFSASKTGIGKHTLLPLL